MRESTIEKHLVKSIKAIGGGCYKWSGPGDRGKPDRLILMPDGLTVFVELKAPGKRPSKLQRYWLEKLSALGFDARVIDTLEGVDELVQELEKR
jgi:hypothetical protein